MLIYRLETVDPNTLRVKLEEFGSKRILYMDTLKGIAKPKDLPALQLLTKLHLKASGGRNSDTLSFQTIELPSSHSFEALQLMAATEQLFFRGQKLKMSGKGGKIYWKGEKHSEKSATLSAYFNELPLESVDVLMPGWAIVAGELYKIDTNVPWKWIELFRKGAHLLEGMQKKNFLEEEPHVVWKEKIEEPFQVFPQLVLTDRTGSFANLWMDYPNIGRVAFEDLAPSVGGKSRLKKEELQWEKDLLESGYIRKTVSLSRYYCPGEKTIETLRFLLEIGWSCIDFQGRKVVLQTGTELSAKEEKGISLRGRVIFGEKSAPFGAIPKASSFIEIDAHHVGLLDLKKIPLIEGDWEGDTLHIPRSRIGELEPFIGKEGVHIDERVLIGRGEPLTLDDRFAGELLPYQKEGVEWLSFLYKSRLSGLLSDEMGLGKTVQVVAFFSQIRTNLPILVVAPTSLLFHWKKELHRFFPTAKVYVHAGSERLSSVEGEQIVLVSYSLLRMDLPIFQKVLFEVVALDESQAIKTYSSQAAQASYSLKALSRIAITGTPVENRSDELWSQFHFLMPELLGERKAFQTLSAELIRKRLKPFILRRKKSDVQLQLPEKVDHPVWIEMEQEQKSLYEKMLSEFKSGLAKKIEVDGLQAHRMEVLEVILRLRQICTDPRLFGGEKRGAKMEKLLNDLEELRIEGKKVLIFSQFTTALSLIEKELVSIGIEPLRLDGSTSIEQREAVVNRFQSENLPHVFLLSLKAGGVGLNLTAAEHVILFDPWWNEAVEKQAIDRAHRIGQKKSLFVQRYLTPDTIEEKMMSLKANKLEIAENLLSEGPTQITIEDLLHLVS